MTIFAFFTRRGAVRVPRTAGCRAALRLEELESRVVPYATSGNLWPHPELVTLSFQPDGTNLGGVSSNLFAQFNAAFGSTSAWQHVLLRAAQTWAAQTNLNFSVLADNGADSGAGAYQQGDSNFGDIRIGGFAIPSSETLALAYMPPAVNNYSVAGDIVFNTNQIFNINGLDYDLFSVAVHEFGHALGLDHSETTSAMLYPTYQGAETSLYADDIAGIRAIYSQGVGRSADAFDAVASNGSFATANDITSWIDGITKTAQLNGLDVTATNDADFYKFTVPEGAASTIRIGVQSAGLSLLAPSLRVYNSNLSLAGNSSGNGYYGSTLTITLNNVTAGQVYYIRVASANSSVFGIGAYSLGLNLDGGSVPTAPPPDTQTANGDPLNGGGGVANRRDANGLSINLLLGQTVRTVQHTISSLGLGFLNPLLSRTTSQVELPFADRFDASLDGTKNPTSADLVRALPGPSMGQSTTLQPNSDLPVPQELSFRAVPAVLIVSPAAHSLATGASSSAPTVFLAEPLPEPSEVAPSNPALPSREGNRVSPTERSAPVTPPSETPSDVETQAADVVFGALAAGWRAHGTELNALPKRKEDLRTLAPLMLLSACGIEPAVRMDRRHRSLLARKETP